MIKENQIENIMNSTLSNLKRITDVETIVGKPIVLPDNSILIPVSKVTMGFLIGGGEYDLKSKKELNEFPLAGGSSAGVSVVPIGFLHATVTKCNFIKTTDSPDKFTDLIISTINSFKNKGKNE